MTPQSRMAEVTQLVQSVHKNQEKELQRNQMLVKLAAEQYQTTPAGGVSASVSTPAPVSTPTANGYRSAESSRGFSDYRSGSGGNGGAQYGYNGHSSYKDASTDSDRNQYGKRGGSQEYPYQPSDPRLAEKVARQSW